MLAQSVNHVTLDTSSSPTKSEWDSADAKPTERSFKGKGVGGFRGIVRFWNGWWCGNPSGSRPNFFGRQRLTFDKGGKCGGAGRGIVRFWEGWCGARYYCLFAMVVGMERVDATGGASPLPYEKWVG